MAPQDRRRPALHRTILVVDVEGFGALRRTNKHQVSVRDGLYRALRAAFQKADIAWEECRYEDRGDGVLVLAPPELPKALFAELPPEPWPRRCASTTAGTRTKN